MEGAADELTESAGIIKYSSQNQYFIDQTFVYEAGSVINSQEDGNIMNIKPTFTITDEGEGTYKILFKMVDIVGVGNKLSTGGYGPMPIQTDYESSTKNTINEE